MLRQSIQIRFNNFPKIVAIVVSLCRKLQRISEIIRFILTYFLIGLTLSVGMHVYVFELIFLCIFLYSLVYTVHNVAEESNAWQRCQIVYKSLRFAAHFAFNFGASQWNFCIIKWMSLVFFGFFLFNRAKLYF